MSLFSRLYRGETTFNFIGRRWIGFGFSLFLVVVTVVSLFSRGLNLGIDFKGGVAWEVPAATLTIDDVTQVLEDNKLEVSTAKIQELSGADGRRIRAQVGDQPAEVRTAVQNSLASKAGVEAQDVSVSAVSSSWGRSITEKAVRALIVFFILVSIFISFRFEWKMAVSAILAMVHDVLLSVGVYSVTGFSVTPATVIAFLTILGFSLYDTIVVFDKVHDNTKRLSASRASYGDVVNVSMNQVLMRSLNTSLAAVLPVLSLLVLGAGVLGVVSLQDFALALLVGLLLGAYSSIYIATPILAVLKEREEKYRTKAGQLSLGEDMLKLFGVQRTEPGVTRDAESGAVRATPRSDATTIASTLTHPPRPRKKRRR
jgi:preprotein translocase subunit SecF